MRIAINSSYGCLTFPKGFKHTNNKNFRVQLAEYIDNLKINCYNEISCQEDLIKLINKNGYAKMEEGSIYFMNDGIIKKLIVKNVDTSKVWCIKEYDGCESIEYFKEPELVDKELNMYRW